MQPILVRMELGTVDGPVPNFSVIVDEFVQKSQEAGVAGVRPAMKIKEVLEQPEKWGATPGAEGYVAFLGTQAEHGEQVVAALSKITVAVPAVISVKILTPTEVDEFQALARQVSEIRKDLQKQSATLTTGPGRHASPPTVAAGYVPPAGSAPVSDEPFMLALGTPEDASKIPLDIVNLVR
ncbi:hypothetical protein [Mycobacterium intracellulare]|uniref:hypothetical protein n=1 Tax=Mycobacterium intracellulare TaxID=1767 RepID=UPI001EED909C|nr:hypothetical protein [Mycobacterium intracellulare]MEE3755257.1 hypothetical protein [Mycobacterium intracellulare]